MKAQETSDATKSTEEYFNFSGIGKTLGKEWHRASKEKKVRYENLA